MECGVAKYNILKALDYDKLPVKFKKAAPFDALVDMGWWMQPKYDGCFGMAVIKHNRADSRMLSRTGEDYTASCGHILDELHVCVEEAGGCIIDDGFVVLGEVWHPEWSFPKISGSMRRRAPCPDLHFVANDLLPAGLVSCWEYKDRYEDLLGLVGGVNSFTAQDQQVYAALTTSQEVRKFNESPTEWAARLKSMGGYDGVILRDPRAGYTVGDAKRGEIIKVKPVMSLDLRIGAIITDVGAKTGRDVYSIAVDYNGVTSLVGSGMPHVLDFSIGDIAEVECMGITEDGKLREPRFKGIRHDKLKAD